MYYFIVTILLGTALPSLSFAAETPTLGAGPIFDASYLIKLGGGLALVIVLFVAMAWVMRNMGVGTVSKDGMERLKVTATLSVGNRERIVLVNVDGDQVLIGVTQERIETLHTIPSASRDSANDFQAQLNKSLNNSSTKTP